VNAQSFLNQLLRKREIVLLFALILYCIVVAIINPAFIRPENLFDIVKSSAGMMILAMGLLTVIISGGIDVSFTAIAIFGGYVTIRLMIALGLDSLFLAFILSAFIGVLLGLLNGLLVHKFRILPLIATLATQNIFIGILSIFFGTRFIPVREMPKSIVNFGTKPLLSIHLVDGGIANLSLFLIPVVIVIFVTWFVLNVTVLGRSVYAIGSNIAAAKRSGINVAVLRYFVYAYMGMLAGVMGIVYAAEVRSLNPISLVGQELTIIAAVVLGGAKLEGGSGNILGTVLAVLLISILNTTLIFIGLSASWNDFFVGIIIILSVSVTSYRSKMENEKNLIFR